MNASAEPALDRSPPGRPQQPAPSTTADLVAAAALGVPAVRRLHGGRAGHVATYLPGRLVSGVRLTPGRCEVHVAVDLSAPLADTATAVRAAVAQVPAVAGWAVDVVIEDVER